MGVKYFLKFKSHKYESFLWDFFVRLALVSLVAFVRAVGSSAKVFITKQCLLFAAATTAHPAALWRHNIFQLLLCNR